MKNLIEPKTNISLITTRQESTFDFQHVFLSKLLIDINSISLQTKEISFVFPLYLYPENKGQQSTDQSSTRTPNLNSEIVNQIARNLGLRFTNEKEELEDIPENASPVCYANSDEVTEDFKIEKPTPTFAPIDILDYIYAVLHSPTYREKYKEFLKIDFPRVPYPEDTTTFWKLVKLGGELRQIHLLESPVVDKLITKYPVDGDNVVGKIKYQEDKVFINETQYFANVSQIAWEFYIGGYQPAQKWLKDRKGRELSFEDILHYQKIIVALTETGRIMKEIDQVKIGE
jgi:predicted helicase